MSRRFAVLFPGQGAQEVGMGRDLVKQNDETTLALFDAASAAAGVDIQQIALQGPDRKLAKTAHLQPALSVVEIALFQKLTRAGYSPAAVAGHSVGELSALSACGMADPLDTVRLAALRGRLMAEAAARTPGAMAALMGADFETVQSALKSEPPDGVLDIAAVNGPGQVVLSGDINTVEQTTKRLSERLGIKGTRLRVSGAWHSPHMADAVLPLENALNKMALTSPSCPMVFNRDGLAIEETTAVPGLLAEQLIRPVRFDKVMARFEELGITTFIEIGPGRVLKGLVRLNCPDPDITVHNVSDLRSLDRVRTQLGR